MNILDTYQVFTQNPHMSKTQLEEMSREAEAFKRKLDKLRSGASPAHASIIDKLTSVVDTSHDIINEALESINRRARISEPAR